MAKFAVILPAAGKSSRFKDKHYKKVFANLAGRAVWLHVADRFLNRNDTLQTILVIAPDDREDFILKFGANIAILGIQLVDGGAERADSVEAALAHVQPEADYVCIHDAARPCIVDIWIDKVYAAAEKSGSAISAVPISSTLKRAGANLEAEETVDRSGLWAAQTPQVFRRELLLEAYAKRDGFNATDDAQLVERIAHPVTLVPGSSLNLKITTNEDLRLAEATLKVLPKPKLPGSGHPFKDDEMWR